ncbi:MAG: glycosyltransferase [Bacteroidetes bacterium]|uniref:Glycosyltransferase n=1 Tax=Candidatus Cryptobacteroides merdavium TaxID=2840769 RepID=A0A9D9EBB9_9BACT|nr:glycosyltransferase [Candidatus Cryptobacteroides merdavium]
MAVIVHSHSFDFLSSWDGYSWIKRHILNLKWRRMIRRADHFIVFDRFTAEDLMKYYYIPKSRIVTLRDAAALDAVLQELSAGMQMDKVC